MSLGIGLGAFAKSFTEARKQRLKEEEDKEESAYRKVKRQQDAEDRDREIRNDEEDRTYLRGERTAKTRERERKEGDENALRGVVDQGNKDFQAAVESGEAQPDDQDDWFTKFTLPKYAAQLRVNGDVTGAAELEKWGAEKGTIEAARFFKGAMMKAELGDMGGALEDAIRASKSDGYGGSAELTGAQPLQDAAGNQLGYRVTFTKPDGTTGTKDLATEQIKEAIATYANPIEAFKLSRESATAQKKRQEDLEDYETKALIDQKTAKGKTPKPGAERYADVQKVMTENMELDGLTDAEKDAKIRASLKAQDEYAASQSEGAAATPAEGALPMPQAAPGVLMDNATGKPAPQPEANRINRTPLSAPETSGQPGVGAAAPRQAQQAREQIGLGAAAAPASTPKGDRVVASTPDRATAASQQAGRALASGARPADVAAALERAGVPVEAWPEQAKTAAR